MVALHGIRTPFELNGDAAQLCNRLRAFSKQIADCCNDVVLQVRERKAAMGDPDAGECLSPLFSVSTLFIFL